MLQPSTSNAGAHWLQFTDGAAFVDDTAIVKNHGRVKPPGAGTLYARFKPDHGHRAAIERRHLEEPLFDAAMMKAEGPRVPVSSCRVVDEHYSV